jgi:hypothetical protein
MKVRYDAAVNMAKKLFAGNEFVRAAAKYKEVSRSRDHGSDSHLHCCFFRQ